MEYQSKYNPFHANKLFLEDKEANLKKIIEDLEKKFPKRIQGFQVKTKSTCKHRKRKHKKRKQKKEKQKKKNQK